MTKTAEEKKLEMTPARLAGVAPIPDAPDLAVFRVEPQSGSEVPAFEAGQYTTLGLEVRGEFTIRYYSIASAPEQRDRFEFYVVKLGGHEFTPELFHLEAGDPIWFGKPGGTFTLARTDRPNLAFVASGTGIAPFVSILRHLGAEAGAGHPYPGSITLWHGVRRTADLAYRAEMEELERAAPFAFRYVPTVSRHADDPRFRPEELARGRVNDLLAAVLEMPLSSEEARPALAGKADAGELRAMLPGGDTGIFLCGNPGMIQAFEASAEGSPWHQHLVFERYW